MTITGWLFVTFVVFVSVTNKRSANWLAFYYRVAYTLWGAFGRDFDDRGRVRVSPSGMINMTDFRDLCLIHRRKEAGHGL